MASNKNPYLKRANEQHEYSGDHIAELKRCSESSVYFIQNYCQIQHPTRGSIPFELYPYQVNMLDTYQENKQVIVLSARQTGKCCQSETTIAVLGESINTTKKIILWIFNRKVYEKLFGKMRSV